MAELVSLTEGASDTKLMAQQKYVEDTALLRNLQGNQAIYEERVGDAKLYQLQNYWRGISHALGIKVSIFQKRDHSGLTVMLAGSAASIRKRMEDKANDKARPQEASVGEAESIRVRPSRSKAALEARAAARGEVYVPPPPRKRNRPSRATKAGVS